MHKNNPIAHLRQLLFGALLAVTLAPTPTLMVAHAEGPGSLTISPTDGKVGSKFHVHGTGFVNFSLITNALDLTVFDATNAIVDQGSVPTDDSGSIDAEIDTSSGSYTSGTYSVMASYTYWGARRDPSNQLRNICDFCPIKTVPLADSVTFTIQ